MGFLKVVESFLRLTIASVDSRDFIEIELETGLISSEEILCTWSWLPLSLAAASMCIVQMTDKTNNTSFIPFIIQIS